MKKEEHDHFDAQTNPNLDKQLLISRHGLTPNLPHQMKTLTLYLVALVCLASLLVGCREMSYANKTGHIFPGWGTAVTPDNDCKFSQTRDAFLISVPGTHPHDLAPELNVINAPRVLQAVHGDFIIQVCIEGGFKPGNDSTLSGRVGYNGAGIVAMLDAQNVVTLARAVLQRPGQKTVPYANFEIRVAGQLQRIGLTGDHTLPLDGPVFLRLERRGSKFLGSVSMDGINWTILKAKDVPPEWSKELQTGIVAISTSAVEFTPRFSKLQILK